MGQCIVVTTALDTVEPGTDGWVRIESQGTTIVLSPLTVDDIFAAGIKSRRAAVRQEA